ncbi:hypothetical protein EDB81DRAFT_805436 [Dactylonectria macrodidyma]|uniref:Uncharacterized protein n=1 Tax=Dactylonectria macrodidyma TaxID=307937 RepID=A0A9P9E9Z2_9HYPO|nr:hypothetical protein EDB81DRAFT_805436 [Dactylonectria macrodidyma]
MMILQGHSQMKFCLHASCFYSKAKARSGLSLGIIALTFIVSLECPLASCQSSQAMASTRSGRTRVPDGVVYVISSPGKEKTTSIHCRFWAWPVAATTALSCEGDTLTPHTLSASNRSRADRPAPRGLLRTDSDLRFVRPPRKNLLLHCRHWS